MLEYLHSWSLASESNLVSVMATASLPFSCMNAARLDVRCATVKAGIRLVGRVQWLGVTAFFLPNTDSTWYH
jgi:hypothetical protein